ncbi:MAG: hypothetical protein JXM71_03090 [Spirochaetales bacterium]|nr:hypothetical protein [Spirochaetales bacterium]
METKDKGQINYYYNRESRLERAGPYATFINQRYNSKRPGLIRSLTATRSLRFLFFAVLITLIGAFIVDFAVGNKDRGSVKGVSLAANAMWFEGYVYATIKRDEPWFSLFGAEPALVPVSFKAGDGVSYATGVMQADEDEFRLRFPAESNPGRIVILASVQTDDEEASLELVVGVD